MTINNINNSNNNSNGNNNDTETNSNNKAVCSTMAGNNNNAFDFFAGTDIEDISRFEECNISCDKNLQKSFYNKIFTEKEQQYCFLKPYPAQHFAVRYAGKEAVIKALSSAGLPTPSCNEIEILKKETGSPYVVIHSKDYVNYSKENCISISISLSHSKTHALAFVILYVKNCLDNMVIDK